MNEDFSQLQATVAALKAELDEVKTKLARLEDVVKFGEDDAGNEVAVVVCHGLNIFPVGNADADAIQLGADENGGYLLLHATGAEEENRTVIQMGLDDGGEPHISLFGRDEQLRAEVSIQQDSGIISIFSEEGTPAVLAQSLEQRGQVTVFDAQGEVMAGLPPIE